MKVSYAPVFYPLLEPADYKGAYGGRSSGKSHFFATMLVARGVQNPDLHAVCIREVQKTLHESAKRVIEMKIRALGVEHLFNVQDKVIKIKGENGRGNGLILFQGMNNQNADSIRSLESYDIAWVEEAQTLAQTSLTALRPTIRNKGSEIWLSWNPRKADDPVDAFLRGAELPPRARVVKANWSDNPWFYSGTRLEDERAFDERRDRDSYEHVWEGEYERRSESRVFTNWRVEGFEPPTANDKLYAGADWGHIDPTVLVVCFVRERTLYVWREAWGVRVGLDRTVALFDTVDPSWSAHNASDPNWHSLARSLPIMADGADPANIDYMQRHGFPRMMAAKKGPGSIESGILFLQSYTIIVHPDCPRVAQELSRYSYKVDKKTNEVLPDLVDSDNHTIDSLRYALENVRRTSFSGRQELRI